MIVPITKEIKEYKLDNKEIQEAIFDYLGLSKEPDSYNSVKFKWEISENKRILGLFVITEKIV